MEAEVEKFNEATFVASSSSDPPTTSVEARASNDDTNASPADADTLNESRFKVGDHVIVAGASLGASARTEETGQIVCVIPVLCAAEQVERRSEVADGQGSSFAVDSSITEKSPLGGNGASDSNSQENLYEVAIPGRRTIAGIKDALLSLVPEDLGRSSASATTTSRGDDSPTSIAQRRAVLDKAAFKASNAVEKALNRAPGNLRSGGGMDGGVDAMVSAIRQACTMRDTVKLEATAKDMNDYCFAVSVALQYA